MQLHGAAGKAMNPIPQPFLVFPGVCRVPTLEQWRFPNPDVMLSVTHLCELATGPAAAGRLVGCPPFWSRTAWEELYRHRPSLGPVLQGRAQVLPMELRTCLGHGDRLCVP